MEGADSGVPIIHIHSWIGRATAPNANVTLGTGWAQLVSLLGLPVGRHQPRFLRSKLRDPGGRDLALKRRPLEQTNQKTNHPLPQNQESPFQEPLFILFGTDPPSTAPPKLRGPGNARHAPRGARGAGWAPRAPHAAKAWGFNGPFGIPLTSLPAPVDLPGHQLTPVFVPFPPFPPNPPSKGRPGSDGAGRLPGTTVQQKWERPGFSSVKSQTPRHDAVWDWHVDIHTLGWCHKGQCRHIWQSH